MVERKLASIQKVEKLEPVFLIETGEEASNIELATVLGWKLVVKKGEFKAGELCIYFELDSILPIDAEWAQFLKPKKYTVKIMKLNKFHRNNQPVISQGLALPLSILPDTWWLTPDRRVNYSIIGEDVTEILGVKKFEPVEVWTNGQQKGYFHPSVPKTDEKRIQSNPLALMQLHGKPYYITLKLDGTSCTVTHDDQGIRVFSRNFMVGEDSNYYRVAQAEGLFNIPPGFAVQGEIVGEGIQGNKLGLEGNKFFAFNVFDIIEARYLSLARFVHFCTQHNINTVPILEVNDYFGYSIEGLEAKAKGFYRDGVPQEGIVIRPVQEEYSTALGGRLSFKCINTDFLLSGGT